MFRFLLPAQRGELRPAHEQVEPGCQHVQATRRCWGRSLYFDLLQCHRHRMLSVLLSRSSSWPVNRQAVTGLFRTIWYIAEHQTLYGRFKRWGWWTGFFMPSGVMMLLLFQILSNPDSTAWKGIFLQKRKDTWDEQWASNIFYTIILFHGFRYDPATDTWTMVANLSVGRDAIGDTILCLFSLPSSSALTSWIFSRGVCVLGEKLFAVGGYDGSGYLSLVEAYDSRWSWCVTFEFDINT